jgi:hypothetical protein
MVERLTLTTWSPSVTVAPYDLSADAPQPGGNPIDTGDTRLPGAVHRYGKLYTGNTTRTVGSGLSPTPNAYANVQWYEITPGGAAVSRAVVPVDNTVAHPFPAVLPGCTTATTTATCATPFVGLQVSGWGPTQPASAFIVRDNSSPAVYQAGVAGYSLNSRWGDYPAVSADPADPTRIWVLGEYAQAANAWGTAVTSVP